MGKQTPRQAVILIHGIGEQRPMESLRSFVEAAGITDPHNKPDRFSHGHELRRLSASSRNMPMTDFYELYWAHLPGRGRFGATLRWAGRLLVRRPFWRHDAQLRSPMLVMQASLLVLAVLAVVVVLSLVRREGVGQAFLWVAGTVAVVAAAAHLVTGYVVTRILADAARYLTPSPEHVGARNKIRDEGLHLLRGLHDSGDYERIVVVGHSLGSVIGYDVLRLAFDELRELDTEADTEADHPHPAANGFRNVVRKLPPNPRGGDLTAFQQAQNRLWREYRTRGARWLVTDFVTFGSPLAHASLLLDTRKVSFQQRTQEGELPTCPPTTDTFYPVQTTRPDGSTRTTKVATSSSPFAFTRWSNAWFPVGRGFGDPVGGPVAPHFGPGVRDVRVRIASRRRHVVSELFLVAHTKYFRKDLDPDAATPPAEVRSERRALDKDSTGNTRVAHLMLQDFLKLDTRHGPSLPPPPAPRRVTGSPPPVTRP